MNPTELWTDLQASGWVNPALFGLVGLLLFWMLASPADPLPGRIRSLEQRRNELRQGLLQPGKRRATTKAPEGGWLVGLWRQFFQRQSASSTLSTGEGGKGDAAARSRLARAGYRSQRARSAYAAARILCPIGFAAVTALLVWNRMLPIAPSLGPIAIIAAAIFGRIAPGLYLTNRAQKRRDAIRRQMPDGFDLLVICAEAGLSLHSALERVAREAARGAPELADEFALTALELSFLPDRHSALTGLSQRAPLPGMRALVNTFVQTERYGTPLAQALRVLASEMREERMLRAEEKGARLPAILTVPMIVFILPPLFIVLMGPAILSTIDSLSTLR